MDICDEVNTYYRDTHHVLIHPHAPWNVQVLRPVDPIFRGPDVALAESLKEGEQISCRGGSTILDHLWAVK